MADLKLIRDTEIMDILRRPESIKALESIILEDNSQYSDLAEQAGKDSLDYGSKLRRKDVHTEALAVKRIVDAELNVSNVDLPEIFYHTLLVPGQSPGFLYTYLAASLATPILGIMNYLNGDASALNIGMSIGGLANLWLLQGMIRAHLSNVASCNNYDERYPAINASVQSRVTASMIFGHEYTHHVQRNSDFFTQFRKIRNDHFIELANDDSRDSSDELSQTDFVYRCLQEGHAREMEYVIADHMLNMGNPAYTLDYLSRSMVDLSNALSILSSEYGTSLSPRAQVLVTIFKMDQDSDIIVRPHDFGNALYRIKKEKEGSSFYKEFLNTLDVTELTPLFS